MSNAKVGIDASINNKPALQGLKTLQTEIKRTGQIAEQQNKKMSVGGGLGKGRTVLSKGGTTSGLSGFGGNVKNFLGDKLGGLTSKFGGIGGRLGGLARLGPYGAAIAATIGLPVMGYKVTAKRAEQGQARFNQERSLNNNLGNLNRNMGGSGDVSRLTKDLIELGIKGSIPVENLTKTAQRMMLAFKGNQSEVRKWTALIADMAAGTGESADFFAELITKAQQFGRVENESLKQMNEKGIPIYRTLADILGVSAEEAKKMAEQGKITASQFKKAAEEAVKISVAGANQNNVIKNAQYYQKQTQELQNDFYARTYTAEFEKVRTEHAKREHEAEKAYLTRQDVETMHETWARMGAQAEDLWLTMKDGWNDLMRDLGEELAGVMAWLENKINDTQNINAQNSMNKLDSHVAGLNLSAQAHGVTLSELAYGMEDSDSVAKLSSKIETMKKLIEQTEHDIADKYVDEERRKNGEVLVQQAKEQLKVLEATLEKKQKDIELEQERQRLAKRAKEIQVETLLSDAQHENDYIKAWRLNHRQDKFTNADEVRTRYDEAKQNMRSGKGTDADVEFVKHFKPMFDMIEKKQKEEEAKAKGRENFELSYRAKNGDRQAAFQIDMNRTLEQMVKLGYSLEDINKHVSGEQDKMIKDRENKLFGMNKESQTLQDKIDFITGGLSILHTCNANCYGRVTTYERGAWGQGLALQTGDPTVHQLQQQRKQLEEQNAKLQCQINLFKTEIEAIQKLNIVPRAL